MKTAAQIYGDILGAARAGARRRVRRIASGRPFGPRRARLAAEAFGESSAESIALAREIGEGIEQALVERVRRFSPMDAGALGSGLDGPTIALAAHLHDAMAAFHPDLAGLFRGSARTEVIELAIEAMVAMPPPSTVREALLRHAWLGTLPRFTLARRRVVVDRTPHVLRARAPRASARVARGAQGRAGRAQGARAPAARAVRRARLERARRAVRARARRVLRRLAAHRFRVRGSPRPAVHVGTTATRTLVATKAGNRLARRVIASSEEGGRFAREAIAATRAPEAASITA